MTCVRTVPVMGFTCDIWILGTDEDLEYFVRECGDILGISNKLPTNKRSAKDVLEYVMKQVVEFKKLNQVGLLISICDFVIDLCTLKYQY